MSALPLFTPAGQARPLRPHQHKAMALLKRSLVKGNRRTVLQMPTGAGKTRTAAEIVAGALAKGNRVCFTVPMISLIDQTVESFEGEGISHVGVIQSNHARTDWAAPVQIASVQTLSRRECPPLADVVIVDECHQQFEIIRDWMRDEPNTVFIGLSATPWARGMGDDWQELVTPVSLQELIDAGFLSPFRVFAPSHPDLSGVRTVAGDYNQGQLGEVMGDRVLVADVVDTWLKRANGAPTLVFAVDLAHARKLQDQFQQRGVAMGYCDARVDLIERQLLFDRVKRGELAGIVNVGTLTTGVDADIRCIVLARPTKSEMLFVQMIGRGLRTAPGKTECLILDHADNHARLGFVCDIHHDRLLTGSEKAELTQRESGEKIPRECPSCGNLKKGGECPSCGFKPERQSEIEFEEGELVEVTPKAKVSKADKQEWLSGLMALAAEKRRSSGWVSHTFRKKFGVWPHHSLEKRLADPSPEVRSYVKHLDIAFAKARGAK